MASTRNFKAVVKNINSYVQKNPSTTDPSSQPPKPTTIASTLIQQQYIPPGLNLQQLSSSQQQRLRDHGVIKRISKKPPLSDRIQQRWKHDKFKEIIEKKKEVVIVKSNQPAKITFTSEKVMTSDEVWNLLKEERIFIREVKIDNKLVRVGFANQIAAERAVEIVKRAGKYTGVGVEGEEAKKQGKEQPTITKKSSILDRIK